MNVGVPNSVRRKPVLADMWGCLPGEVQVQILSYLGPKELVRCSAVSIHSLVYDVSLCRASEFFIIFKTGKPK